MKWKLKNNNDIRIKKLAEKYNISELLITIFLNRGWKEKDIETFNNELGKVINPGSNYKDMEKALDIIEKYSKDKNAVIFIRADYDVDGLTSGYIMTDGIKRLSKAEVICSYPERKEGYGLQIDFCNKLLQYKENNPNKKILLITVDNGIASAEEIDYLIANDIQVIVTDHHPLKETIPNCIVLDAYNEEDPSQTVHLCGAGVAFKVIQNLYRRNNCIEFINQYLSIVAIGTIADMMPMTLENISYCIYGLKQINSHNCHNGIRKLLDYKNINNCTFTDIGFNVAPDLNACGRMGSTVTAGKLLFDKNQEDNILENDVINIERLNDQRKQELIKIMPAVEIQVTENDIDVIILEECTEGLAGIIVNKLLNKYYKSFIVLIHSGNFYTGSARSVDELNIKTVLEKEQEQYHTLYKFGGHEKAAGITIKSDMLNDFIKHMHKIKVKGKEQTVIIDKQLKLNDVNWDNYNIINSIPYDKDNFTEPIFLFDVQVEKTQMTTKQDKMWFYIKDKSIKISKKLLLSTELMNSFTKLKNKQEVLLIASLQTDFTCNNKSITLKPIDIKEK